MKKLLTPVFVASLLLAGCNQAPTSSTPTPTNTQATASGERQTTAAVNASVTITTAPTMEAVIASQQAAMGDNILKFEDLSFTLPKGWTLQKMVSEDKLQTATLSVPDPKYKVTIPMQVHSASKAENIQDTQKLLKETSNGAKIYDYACAPGIACYYVVSGGKTYEVSFGEPSSDQPVPKDLDGVWFPDTTVTADDTLTFTATVQ